MEGGVFFGCAIFSSEGILVSTRIVRQLRRGRGFKRNFRVGLFFACCQFFHAKKLFCRKSFESGWVCWLHARWFFASSGLIYWPPAFFSLWWSLRRRGWMRFFEARRCDPPPEWKPTRVFVSGFRGTSKNGMIPWNRQRWHEIWLVCAFSEVAFVLAQFRVDWKLCRRYERHFVVIFCWGFGGLNRGEKTGVVFGSTLAWQVKVDTCFWLAGCLVNL